jgi:hypothetical protein
MKPIINTLSQHRQMILLPVLFIWKKKKGKLFLVLCFLSFSLTGCFYHFFNTGTLKGINAATIQRLQSENKYFILHAENKTLTMNKLKVTKDNVEAELDTLYPEHAKYLHPNTEKPNRVKANDKRFTLFEVHMYYTGKIDSSTTQFSAPVSSFDRIDIYEFDPKTTSFNHVMSVFGVIAGGLFIAGIIMLIIFAITCNCPQVYVDNGNSYEFVSGVYSGSIYASMERTDYLLLAATQTGHEFKLKIANVKNEKQYINRMQLMKVHHREGVKVLADRHGNIFTYLALQTPSKATTNNNTENVKIFSTIDKESYHFTNKANENGFSSVTMTFKKPVDAQKAKLVVHGGNSLWSGYIYHRFAEMFGNKYEAWRDQKDKADPKEMEQWQKDQALPLMVFVERNGEWEPADYFPHTGNTATRDMIMELDVSNIKGNEVKIKLETAFQFWDLDYAAMDFSENEKTSISFINASSALKTGGADERDMLKEKDNNYCQLQQEEELSIVFTPPGNNNATDTYFLVSTGYYHNTQQYDGAPDLKTLNSFKSKRSFDAYSRQQFASIEESLSKFATKKTSAIK